jgi:DNA-binding transcriptional LysR family regulator
MRHALNWNDLKIFLEVHRAQSLTAAAKQLKIDVSTVSRHIANLEKSLACAVLERTQTGLKITVHGEALIKSIQSMEYHALSMLDHLQTSSEEPFGEVRIATMEGIASFYLAEKFMCFKQRYPNINIELVTSAQLVEVSRRQADLFLSFYPHAKKGLDIFPIGKFQLYLYACPSYIAAHGLPKNKEDLKNHKFITYIPDLISLDSVRWLEELIDQPQAVFRSSSLVSQLFSATQGLGLVMLPEFMHPENFALRKLENLPSVSRVVWLSVHQELRYLPKLKAVIHFLLQEFSKDYPTEPNIKIYD